eukprot:CAMPEP_0206060110 /NCGR_PEP_ID=MMETSP1466-20131121/50474_1 /ASSEMBLY_ACC=CAM_ASM_001126 /TAXON_ID=44452 /ORGANISM="Pavlova gyrans, Strain CCMP608" /LENGTH=145 /DNA_ID=CAMNT_0053435443 /DNA_START=9 /DNA_END=446 /DNA_ORIENTATION=-
MGTPKRASDSSFTTSSRGSSRDASLRNTLAGVQPLVFLSSSRVDDIYSCSTCRTHLAHADAVISKSFTGRHGRAYLLAECVNTMTGPPEERTLLTGLHTVADTFCSTCRTPLGWKYESAHEASQRYKVGKFIVEKARMVQDTGWR